MLDRGLSITLAELRGEAREQEISLPEAIAEAIAEAVRQGRLGGRPVAADPGR